MRAVRVAASKVCPTTEDCCRPSRFSVISTPPRSCATGRPTQDQLPWTMTSKLLLPPDAHPEWSSDSRCRTPTLRGTPVAARDPALLADGLLGVRTRAVGG